MNNIGLGPEPVLEYTQPAAKDSHDAPQPRTTLDQPKVSSRKPYLGFHDLRVHPLAKNAHDN